MRFDAYAGTLRQVDFTHAAEVLAHRLGCQVERGKARRRYGQVLDLNDAGRQVAWVAQDNGNGTVYFEGKGETSPELVKGVRGLFPEHSVARVDVCEDYDGEGVFEQLVGLVRDRKGSRVQGAFVRLPDDPEQGRTWQAGVRGGNAMVRVYEAGKMAERAHHGRPAWTRVEVEARPHYAKDKRWCASADPLHVWGLTRWSWRVGEALAQVPIPRFEPEQQSTSFDKRTLYLARAFRRHWEEMLSDFGDWTCIGREVEEIWRQDDLAQEAMKRTRE